MKSLRKTKLDVYKKMNVSAKKERETRTKNTKRRTSENRHHQHIRTICDGECRHPPPPPPSGKRILKSRIFSENRFSLWKPFFRHMEHQNRLFEGNVLLTCDKHKLIFSYAPPYSRGNIDNFDLFLFSTNKFGKH